MSVNPFTIPARFRQALLPSPTLSICGFLDFPFPPQARSNPPESQYWSSLTPVAFDIENLKCLSIPCRALLQDIKEQVYQYHSLGEAASIRYSHLPTSLGLESFPLWVLTFWIEVSHLRQYVNEPWQHAELWLTKISSTYRKAERQRVCDEAQGVLRDLPWAGDIFGFADDEPVTKLVDYLSDKWLSTIHVNQQLDLLRWELLRSGIDLKCKVVNLAFFLKLLEMGRWFDIKRRC